MTGMDRFHAHLDVCARCAKNPFDLCAEGRVGLSLGMKLPVAMSRKQEWLVEVQIVELHAQIVEADSAEEARAKADANGWGPHTLNDVEPPEPFGDPIPRDEDEE